MGIRLIAALALPIALFGCVSHYAGVRRAYALPLGDVPRMVLLPDVSNFRDIGGWRAMNGMTVRQGMVYRSGRLNKSWRWYRPDFSRETLSERTKRFLSVELGIRTEIDLRKEINCRGMTESPIGPEVRFVNIPANAYDGMASEDGREAFKRVFKVLLRQENYPVLLHCVEGSDRTGSVVFVLNGLLGVSESDLVKAWELSRIWNGRDDFVYDRLLARIVPVFDGYNGATLRERIEGYVISLGFSYEDIEVFRRLMLSDAKGDTEKGEP